MALASRRFWHADADIALDCRYHPKHKWVTLRLGDVLEPGRMHNPDERLTICQACYVTRCGSVDDENRCTLRHDHPFAHIYEDGTKEPLGGIAPAHGVID